MSLVLLVFVAGKGCGLFSGGNGTGWFFLPSPSEIGYGPKRHSDGHNEFLQAVSRYPENGCLLNLCPRKARMARRRKMAERIFAHSPAASAMAMFVPTYE